MAGFPFLIKPIQPTDTLNTGWRVITNFNIGKITVNVYLTDDLKLVFESADGSLGEVDFGRLFYSKTQMQNLDVPFASESVAGKIRIASPEEAIEGQTNSSAMTPGMMSQYFEYILSRDFPASEALAAGDLVNVFDDGGIVKARKADSTQTEKFCTGYVKEAAAVGDEIAVYVWGINTGYSGLIPGLPYYLSATQPGKIQASDPNVNFSQLVGVALSPDTLFFQPQPPKPKKEERYERIPMAGELINGEFIPVLEYQIKELARGRQILSIVLQQPAMERTLVADYFDYTPGDGKLIINSIFSPLFNKGLGYDLLIEFATYGTNGIGTGFALKYIPDNPNSNLGYQFANQSTPPIPIQDAKLSINAATDSDVYLVSNAENGYIINHDKDTMYVSIQAYNSKGQPDRNIYAKAITKSQFQLIIPPSAKLNGTILATFFRKQS